MTGKQIRFVEEYLKDLNATQAAIRAGYSRDSAYSIGQENLNKPEIKEKIDLAVTSRAERNKITADRVLQEIASIAFSSVAYLVDWQQSAARLRVQYLLNPEVACAVRHLDFDEKGFKIVMHDKIKALELLGRHLGVFDFEQIKKGQEKDDVNERLHSRVLSILSKKLKEEEADTEIAINTVALD